MSLDADSIVDRRRLRRKLTFWRVAAVVVAIVAIGGLGVLLAPSRLTERGNLHRPRPYQRPDPR